MLQSAGALRRLAQVSRAPCCRSDCCHARRSSRRSGAAAGAAAAAGGGGGGDDASATHECAACKQALPAAAYSRAQLTQKGPSKQRCRECLDAAEKETRAAGTPTGQRLSPRRLLTTTRSACLHGTRLNSEHLKLDASLREALGGSPALLGAGLCLALHRVLLCGSPYLRLPAPLPPSR